MDASRSIRRRLGDQADANEKRLKAGLEDAGEPQPLHFVLQGSYAMRTTVQHPKNDYDIDDGVVFSREFLKGAQGADKTALDARKMVCEALYDDAFNRVPEVRTNRVRVYYNEGHHVDVPVYRMENPDSESTLYELASSDWKESNPEAVTKWFQKQLEAKHLSEEKDGHHQMRRLLRLLKNSPLAVTAGTCQAVSSSPCSRTRNIRPINSVRIRPFTIFSRY
ncbi:nucleotidyltransferase domain-containing protein [Pedosphaera parvula]|uniref:nucleotidyltransferase domain-containing protein n=1 Tax=Pedosphaera parvula TaxID=1032527 RepID=UPI003CCE2FFA